MAQFSKKYYNRMAQAIASTRPLKSERAKMEQWKETTKAVAFSLIDTSPAYDLPRFLRACGFPLENTE